MRSSGAFGASARPNDGSIKAVAGALRPGMKADIVVFNPVTINDRATYEKPAEEPEDVVHVIVNSESVLMNDKHTGRRPGTLVRRS